MAPVIRPVTSSGELAGDRLVGDLAAAAQHGDAVAGGEDVGHAVADQDHRVAGGLEPADQVEHLGDLADADRRGRLVHQHDLRVGEPGAGDRHGLALAAGHRLHQVPGPGLGLQLGEELGGAGVHGAAVEEAERPEAPGDLAAEEDVERRRQVVAEREILVDDLDAGVARLERGGEAHRRAVEAHLAGRGGEAAGDDLDQRRLAGAVVAHEAEDLAAGESRSTASSAWMAPKCLAMPRRLRTGCTVTPAAAPRRTGRRPRPRPG